MTVCIFTYVNKHENIKSVLFSPTYKILDPITDPKTLIPTIQQFLQEHYFDVNRQQAETTVYYSTSYVSSTNRKLLTR
jgi:hypothetical protein